MREGEGGVLLSIISIGFHCVHCLVIWVVQACDDAASPIFLCHHFRTKENGRNVLLKIYKVRENNISHRCTTYLNGL